MIRNAVLVEFGSRDYQILKKELPGMLVFCHHPWSKNSSTMEPDWEDRVPDVALLLVLDHSKTINPPQTPTSTIARPYVRPKPIARACARSEASLLAAELDEEPPKPEYVPVAVLSAVLVPEPLVDEVDMVLRIVEVFTWVGF